MTRPDTAPRPATSLYDVAAASEEIRLLRAQLLQTRDTTTITALSTALRQRFFSGSGQLEDLQESMSLLDETPRPTVEEIGTAEITFRPELAAREHNWVQWQPWIEQQGYTLPSRLHADWVPSWLNASDSGAEFDSPDAFGSKHSKITDAIRIHDGQRVFFKLCSANDQEFNIAAYFSSQPRRSDPRNHCYPLLDVLRPPLLRGEPYLLLVFPLLRPFFEPDPDTIEDLITSIIALAEGLAFMHEHHAAHRDIHYRNAMMDATYLMPAGWHPWMSDAAPGEKPQGLTVLSRSQVPMKYYLTDFGMSVQFGALEDRALVTGIGGLNRGLPEQSETIPYDPFPADVRMFGDMLRNWQHGFLGLGFLDPVVVQLRQEDPLLRPTASEMVLALKSLLNRSRFSLQLPLRRRESPGTSVKVWLQYLSRVISVPGG